MGYLTAANIGGSDYKLAGAIYGTCSTAAGTATKVVTCSDFDALETGVTIAVKFSNGNDGSKTSVKLNVNSTGAVTVLGSSGSLSVGTAAQWDAGEVVLFTYDGSYWVMDTHDQDHYVGQIKSSSNGSFPLLASDAQIGVSGWGGRNSGTEYPSVALLNEGAYLIPGNGYVVANKFSSDGTNFYEFGGSVTDGDTGLVTGDAVYDAIAAAIGQATGSMVYQGTVSAASGLLNSAQKAGYVYMASSAFTITDGSSIVHGVEIGDMIIFNTDGTPTTQSALWNAIDLIQTNMDALTTSDVDAAIAEAEAA